MITDLFFKPEELPALLAQCSHLEVHGARSFVMNEATGETNTETCEDSEAQFFSAYCRYIPHGGNNQFGGVECLGDFPTRQTAEEYADSIRHMLAPQPTSDEMTSQNDQLQCSAFPWLPGSKDGNLEPICSIDERIADVLTGDWKSEEFGGNARLIVAACNAVGEVSKAKGINPVILAEALAGGGLLKLIKYAVAALYEMGNYDDLIQTSTESDDPDCYQSWEDTLLGLQSALQPFALPDESTNQ